MRRLSSLTTAPRSAFRSLRRVLPAAGSWIQGTRPPAAARALAPQYSTRLRSKSLAMARHVRMVPCRGDIVRQAHRARMPHTVHHRSPRYCGHYCISRHLISTDCIVERLKVEFTPQIVFLGEWIGHRELDVSLGYGALAVPATTCGKHSSITLLAGGVRTEALAVLSSSGCTPILSPDNPAAVSVVLVAPEV